MAWLVYAHENRANGKRYIGITGQKPEKRWKNGLGYMGSPHFWAAIQKYGWDGFRHEILYTDLTQAEAERLEVELIAKYRTQDPAQGYNMAKGGNTTEGLKISPEGCRNISLAHIGVRHSAKTRAKMTESRRGSKNHFFGRHHTEGTVLKIVSAHGGRAVLCVETGEVYISLGEVERKTGINRYQVSGCCNNKPSCHTAGGYHWRFTDTKDITAREEVKA